MRSRSQPCSHWLVVGTTIDKRFELERTQGHGRDTHRSDQARELRDIELASEMAHEPVAANAAIEAARLTTSARTCSRRLGPYLVAHTGRQAGALER